MNKVKFGCLPTAIGSFPDTDPEAACRRVLNHLHDIPCWPQLPRRGTRENMYLQFGEGFPGAVFKGEHIVVEKSAGFDGQLEELYAAYLDGNVDRYAISPDSAAGLYECIAHRETRPRVIKGQITGPISWGLAVTDPEGRGIIYDDTLADAAAKFLRLKAAWEEKKLRELTPDTIIFIDEPYLTSLGSAFVSLSPDRVRDLIGEVLCGIDGTTGIHCCGGAEWPLLLGLPVDIVNFDAYNYAVSFGLYPTEVKAFLKRGGTVAWGIVPTDEELIPKETVASLSDRFGEAVAPFTRNGFGFRDILEQSLLTPSCGLASLSSEAADQALSLLTGLSAKLRQRL